MCVTEQEGKPLLQGYNRVISCANACASQAMGPPSPSFLSLPQHGYKSFRGCLTLQPRSTLGSTMTMMVTVMCRF